MLPIRIRATMRMDRTLAHRQHPEIPASAPAIRSAPARSGERLGLLAVMPPSEAALQYRHGPSGSASTKARCPYSLSAMALIVLTPSARQPPDRFPSGHALRNKRAQALFASRCRYDRRRLQPGKPKGGRRRRQPPCRRPIWHYAETYCPPRRRPAATAPAGRRSPDRSRGRHREGRSSRSGCAVRFPFGTSTGHSQQQADFASVSRSPVSIPAVGRVSPSASRTKRRTGPRPC